MRVLLLALLGACRLYGPPDPPGPDATTPPPVDLIAQFAACTTFDDFRTSGMGPAWANIDAGNTVTCGDCHVANANGFLADPDEGHFFARMRRDRNVFQEFFTVDEADRRVIVNLATLRDIGAGSDFVHPQLPTESNNAGLLATRLFHTLTEHRLLTGPCGPPPF